MKRLLKVGMSLFCLFVLVSIAGSCNKASTPTFDVAGIRDYLDQNFAGTTWYSPVQKFTAPGGGRLNVYTDLYPDAEGERFAQDICRKIYANVSNKGVTEVAVFGQGNKLLARYP